MRVLGLRRDEVSGIRGKGTEKNEAWKTGEPRGKCDATEAR